MKNARFESCKRNKCKVCTQVDNQTKAEYYNGTPLSILKVTLDLLSLTMPLNTLYFFWNMQSSFEYQLVCIRRIFLFWKLQTVWCSFVLFLITEILKHYILKCQYSWNFAFNFTSHLNLHTHIFPQKEIILK